MKQIYRWYSLYQTKLHSLITLGVPSETARGWAVEWANTACSDQLTRDFKRNAQ